MKNKLNHILSNLDKIIMYRRSGATIQDICDMLEVSLLTLNKYRKTHPELDNAIKQDKEQILSTIEDSLYQQSVGRIITLSKTEYRFDTKGREYPYKRTVEERYIPASAVATRLAVTNIAPDKWKVRYNQPEKETMDDATQNFKSLGESVMELSELYVPPKDEDDYNVEVSKDV